MLDLTSFNPMIKEHYAPLPVINMAAQNNKALGLLTKRNRKASGDGGGKYWVQPIQYADPGGGSSDFTTANAYTDNESQYAAFQVTRKKHYRITKVDNETIEATAAGNVDAFEPAFDEFDKSMRAEGNYLNFRFFRTKGGHIGKMTNGSYATTVLTLDDPAGTWGVRRNDVLNLASTDGTSGAIRSGSLKVASVQRRAGTITLTGNISTGVAAAAQNDYVFLSGDFGLASSGMMDWAPDSAPGATSFYGVDRTADDMLGGLRIDATDGRPTHEALIDAVSSLDEYGADPDVAFANPRALATLTKQLEGKWVIMKGQGYGGQEADIGYRGWQVTIEGHEVTLFSERCCQVSRMFVSQLDTWTLFSAGMAPNFITKRAGSIIKISETADAYEARVGEYYNFSNKAPSYTCNVQL